MTKQLRRERILRLLADCEQLSISEIARRIGPVSEVTVRRDVAALAAAGRLSRQRGAAARLGAPPNRPPAAEISPIQLEDADALVLAPVEGRSANTLRLLARRRNIPFLAESSPQDFGTYCGPNNFACGRALGNRAGRELSGRIKSASILIASIEQLPNTRARCTGFERGFAETFDGPMRHRRIDSRGSYRVAFERSRDAMEVDPAINVVFGVNDHAILAGLDAAEERKLVVFGYSVGAEGAPLFDVLAHNGSLRACVALFPEVVGIMAIDRLVSAMQGEPLPEQVETPYAIMTPDNLGQFYEQRDGQWVATDTALERLLPSLSRPQISARRAVGKTIGFAPHYPAHDWYRRMEAAMRKRCAQSSVGFRVAEPQAGIAREIGMLRRLTAECAATTAQTGETVLINAGPMAAHMAHALAENDDLRIITNALDVLERLGTSTRHKVMMTSGEFDAERRCLVGPSLCALMETVRADRAFLSVDGITPRFGASAHDERIALVARRFAAAARCRLFVADHSLVGIDATHRILSGEHADHLYTDSGTLAADRVAFAEAGMSVTVTEPGDTASRAI